MEIVQAGKKRFASNVFFNIVSLGVSIVLNLWMTPYLIHHLSIGVYGLIPLALSVTTYMSIFTQGIHNAAGRFLTIDLVQENHESAKITFNTTLWGILGVLVFVTFLVIGLSWISPSVFDVPQGQELQTRILFLCIGTSFMLGVLSSVISLPTYSYNRFDLRQSVTILNLLTRAGLLVVMFAVWGPKLGYFGLSSLLAGTLTLICDIYILRRLAPNLQLGWRYFNFSVFRDLFGMGGWIILNQIGALLFVNIDLIVVNTVFGAVAGGKYGSILLFSTLLRNLASTVSGVIGPIVVGEYAHGNITGMVRLSKQAVKLMGVGLALPIGLLCGLAKPVLLIWLGADFQEMASLMVVLLGHLCVNLAIQPLLSLNSATNHVRTPGLVTLGLGVANFLLAMSWARWGGWGVVGVAAAGAVVLTLKNFVFTPIYAAKILNQRWCTFYTSLLPSFVLSLGTGLLSYSITLILSPINLLELIIIIVFVSVLYLIVICTIIFNRDDYRLFKSIRFASWRR